MTKYQKCMFIVQNSKIMDRKSCASSKADGDTEWVEESKIVLDTRNAVKTRMFIVQKK